TIRSCTSQTALSGSRDPWLNPFADSHCNFVLSKDRGGLCFALDQESLLFPDRNPVSTEIVDWCRPDKLRRRDDPSRRNQWSRCIAPSRSESERGSRYHASTW